MKLMLRALRILIFGIIIRWAVAGLTAWYRDGQVRMEGERIARWDVRDRVERYWSVCFFALLLLWGASVDLTITAIPNEFWARAAGIAILTALGVFVSVITARRIVVGVTHDAWELREMYTDRAHLYILLLVLVMTPAVMLTPDTSTWIMSPEIFTAGFPLLTGVIAGAWAASVILVDHRSKALLLDGVKASFGGSDAAWSRARFFARGAVTTVRHAPSSAFSDLLESERKLSQVLPEWQIDRPRTDATARRITLIRTTEETEAARKIIERSEGLVVKVENTRSTPIEGSQTPRVDAARYTLATGTTDSRFARVDALAMQDGLRIVTWQPAADFAIVERMPRDVAEARDVIATALKVAPHEIGIEVTRTGDDAEDAIADDQSRRFATIRVVRAPMISLDEEKRQETWRLVTRMIPYGTTGWTVTEGTETVLTWGATREVPALVSGKDLLPTEITPDDWARIPLGIDSTGAVAALDLQAGPHSLIIGPTGSGKSVSTRLLILGAFARGFQVVYIDPVKRGSGLLDLEPWTRGMYRVSAAEAAEVLTAVYAEVTRRVDMIEDARVEDWRSLDVQPMLVMLDEFTGLVRPDAKPARSSAAYDEWEAKAEAQATITTLVSKIAAEARSAGVFLALATQRPDVAYIPGEARSNMGSTVMLVSPNKQPRRATLDMVFDADEIDDAKIEVKDLHGSTPGFALVANEGGGLRGIRVGYIEPDEPASILEALGVPLGDLIVPKHVRQRGDAVVEEPSLPDTFAYLDEEKDEGDEVEFSLDEIELGDFEIPEEDRAPGQE